MLYSCRSIAYIKSDRQVSLIILIIRLLTMKTQKYHYVYRITNILLNKHYYGTRTSKNKTPEEDIGIYYFSSSSDKEFIKDQKDNPQDYRYKIIKKFNTRENALKLEIKLHNKFNVGINESFYNRVKQTSTGFDNTSLDFNELVKIRLKNNSYKSGGVKAAETWKNKSKEEKKEISEKFKDCFSKIDLKGRAANALNSRINNNNLPIGMKNGRANIIKIYDNYNNIKFICEGNFYNLCNENNLPSKALAKSYKNNGKRIYQNRIQKIVKEKGFDKFIGWYALKF